MSDMEVSIWFRREPGAHVMINSFCQVFVNFHFYKIPGCIFILHFYISSWYGWYLLLYDSYIFLSLPIIPVSTDISSQFIHSHSAHRQKKKRHVPLLLLPLSFTAEVGNWNTLLFNKSSFSRTLCIMPSSACGRRQQIFYDHVLHLTCSHRRLK